MTTTAFTVESYERLLDALVAGGYRARFFDEDPDPGPAVLLRHDIDKNLDQALTLAKIEAERGIRASYFFLLRCPLYNLTEPEAVARVRQIQSLGHAVGLHCDHRRMLEARPDRRGDLDAAIVAELGLLRELLGGAVSGVVSFHNPTPDLLRRPGVGFLSAYDERFMPPVTKYISDSNANWREGDPVPSLSAAAWPRVQILVHPIWWVGGAGDSAMDRLDGAFGARVRDLDRYLRYSNDLWRDARRAEEGSGSLA